MLNETINVNPLMRRSAEILQVLITSSDMQPSGTGQSVQLGTNGESMQGCTLKASGPYDSPPLLAFIVIHLEQVWGKMLIMPALIPTMATSQLPVRWCIADSKPVGKANQCALRN